MSQIFNVDLFRVHNVACDTKRITMGEPQQYENFSLISAPSRECLIGFPFRQNCSNDHFTFLRYNLFWQSSTSNWNKRDVPFENRNNKRKISRHSYTVLRWGTNKTGNSGIFPMQRRNLQFCPHTDCCFWPAAFCTLKNIIPPLILFCDHSKYKRITVAMLCTYLTFWEQWSFLFAFLHIFAKKENSNEHKTNVNFCISILGKPFNSDRKFPEQVFLVHIANANYGIVQNFKKPFW